ncbi:MAG: PAS domain S-box protein, partial [Planctomycetales bacterium]|nr:PAS domain S-box protein [Planctomycetales bacterium]
MSTEDRYTWLFRHLPVMAILMDADGRITDVSDAWAARLGYARDEIHGR